MESGYTLRPDSLYIEEATTTMNGVGQSSLMGNNLFQVNHLSNYRFSSPDCSSTILVFHSGGCLADAMRV